jgi:putative spermidine/putrescine transport system substrate-binding protein
MQLKRMLTATMMALSATLLLPAYGQTNITLVAYSGLFQDKYMAAVVEPFMKKNPDIKVTYFGMPGSAAMLGGLRAQKAAPQSDVVIMDVSVSKAGTDEGLFEKIDEKSVPSISELYPMARIPDIAGVAVTFDSMVLLYNSDQVKEAPKSWKAMADKAYQGKVVIPGMPDIQGLSLVMILDKAAGGSGSASLYDKGIQAMGPIAPNVMTWEPKPDVYAPIIAGQAAIGIGWNARAQVNTDTSGGKLRATLPAEGSVFQINTIQLVKGAAKADAARKFINYALGAEAQKAFTESMFYAPTNSKAQIAPSAIDRTAVKQLDRMIPVDWLGVAKVRDQVIEQWRRRVIPLSR